ncbi:protein yellow [Leptidea sinapis]|uniref:protein yellow n=1 Tax=Leptidea sinapis TaxID=189913 RepID=UPI00212B1C2E|nr:protein yellow [Leptidea sinapis]
MGMMRSLIILQVVSISTCMEQLDIKYEWNQLDFEFPSQEDRQQALASGAFVPENNIPMGLEVHGAKMFVTVPRWRHGVPVSLAYVNIHDNSTSPKLIPYPNWAAHDTSNGKPLIVSPFRIRADKCNRLWVLDNGKIGNLENNTTKYPPALLVFDLETDTILRNYVLPEEQVKEDSGFANIAVEDTDCDDTFAYAGDLGKPGIVVYSWKKNDSWRIMHHYFHPDPLACDFSVKGHNFSWTDAIFGMALSAPNADNYSTLYFHPMASYNEFSVSTEYLRNQSVADANFNAFKLLGNRGPNAQSSVSFLDPKTGILFYSLVNLNAVACWRTTNKEYLMKNQGRIYMDDMKMIYPTDIKVDYDDNLWILSNRMPIWMYGKLDSNEVNFRVFTAPVLNAISHTACDVTPRSDILDKFVNKFKNVTNKIAAKVKGTGNAGVTILPSSLSAIVSLCIFSFISNILRA